MTSDIIHAGVVFGVSESLDETRGVSEAYAKPERTEKAFECAQKYNFGKYNSLSVTTPDEKINHIMNQWLKKQIDCCIVGKKGVRDNLQIAVALLNYRQDKAKDEILECLRATGNCHFLRTLEVCNFISQYLMYVLRIQFSG